jgi:hypothetical protein
MGLIAAAPLRQKPVKDCFEFIRLDFGETEQFRAAESNLASQVTDAFLVRVGVSIPAHQGLLGQLAQLADTQMEGDRVMRLYGIKELQVHFILLLMLIIRYLQQ